MRHTVVQCRNRLNCLAGHATLSRRSNRRALPWENLGFHAVEGVSGMPVNVCMLMNVASRTSSDAELRNTNVGALAMYAWVRFDLEVRLAGDRPRMISVWCWAASGRRCAV